MRTVHFRSFATAAVAILTMSGNVAGQDKPTALLNTLEVRQLVSRAEPEDNIRLSAHFSALADRYAAETKRHLSMSQSFVGNPSRNLGTGMRAHCKRLADLNMESATTVRELAVYHEKLARGTSASVPRDAAQFRSGAGASEPTEKELKALAAKASSPSEHRSLEEYFLMLAKRYATDAEQHIALAQQYQGTRLASAAMLHDHLAGLAREEAKEATAAAEMHKQLAGLPQ
jgi:hypothetical protein